MDSIVSAVLADIISRSISFFVDRYRRLQTGGAEESVQHLRRVLLRAQATVEEAERRSVTNQAMLRQLDALRHGMFRGYYALDAFASRGHGDAGAKHQVRKFCSAKRLCTSTSWTLNNMVVDRELRKALDGLETLVSDMEEFMLFLKCYPPMCRQPCSSYLFSDMCMFGRQAEYERIVSSLLQIALPVAAGTGNLSVLPIVGPGAVGKSTLVDHVCYDERVRGFFSSIFFFSGDDLEALKPDENPLQDTGVIKYRNNGVSHGRLLVIMELVGDLEEEIWRRLCCSLVGHMAHGSKIIVTSRSERIIRFGTAHALRLNFLPQEAYWYFFKMIALRNAGSEDYPELSSIAMEIAAELNASFAGANIIGTLLRANTDRPFWREVLEHLRRSTAKHLLMFGEDQMDLLRKERPIYIWGMAGTSDALVVHRCYEVCSPQKEVPKLTMHDILFGRAIPRGIFEFLAWKSQIPPYYSYLVSCSLTTSPAMGEKKKRSRLQSI